VIESLVIRKLLEIIKERTPKQQRKVIRERE